VVLVKTIPAASAKKRLAEWRGENSSNPWPKQGLAAGAEKNPEFREENEGSSHYIDKCKDRDHINREVPATKDTTWSEKEALERLHMLGRQDPDWMKGNRNRGCGGSTTSDSRIEATERAPGEERPKAGKTDGDGVEPSH